VSGVTASWGRPQDLLLWSRPSSKRQGGTTRTEPASTLSRGFAIFGLRLAGLPVIRAPLDPAITAADPTERFFGTVWSRLTASGSKNLDDHLVNGFVGP
jgi:hypothetical protein